MVAGLTGREVRAGVAMVCHDDGGRLLMQLRDDKPGIAFPGHWSVPTGGFGRGGMPTWDEARQAAARELAEEIGVRDATMLPLVCENLEKPTFDLVRFVFQVQLPSGFSLAHTLSDDGGVREGQTWDLLTEAQVFDGRLIPPTILLLLERHTGRPLFSFLESDAAAAGTFARQIVAHFGAPRSVYSDEKASPIKRALQELGFSATGPALHLADRDAASSDPEVDGVVTLQSNIPAEPRLDWVPHVRFVSELKAL